MELWDSWVSLLGHAVVALSPVFGGSLGGAILSVSLLLRMLLLPWTLKSMTNAQAHREKLESLKPELEALKRKFAGDSARQGQETLALYQRHGMGPVPKGMFSGMLVQLPVMAGLSGAIRKVAGSGIRFLWIGDLARPDAWLTAGVAALAVLGAAVLPHGAEKLTVLRLLLPALLTVLFMWKVSAGIGLFWAVSSGVGVAQNLILHRRRVR